MLMWALGRGRLSVPGTIVASVGLHKRPFWKVLLPAQGSGLGKKKKKFIFINGEDLYNPTEGPNPTQDGESDHPKPHPDCSLGAGWFSAKTMPPKATCRMITPSIRPQM